MTQLEPPMDAEHLPPPADPALRTDGELLRSYRESRSAEAFAQLVRRHGSMVYRTCARLLDARQDAEDATQAVFLLLARQPGAARASLPGWLYRAAQTAALKVRRGRARRARREERAARSEAMPPDPAPADLREEIDAALTSLPERLQEVVVVCHLEGRTQEQAARLLGCHQATLSRRLVEALARLRDALLRRGVVVTPAVLVGFLAGEAAAAAPAVVLGTAVAAGAGTAAATGTAAALADGMAKALFWAKAKLYAAVTAAAVVPAAVVVPVVLTRPAEPPAPAADPRVVAVAYSPDGKTLASAHADHTVRLRDPATGRERAVLAGHAAPVHNLAFAPAGGALWSVDRDGRGLVWDVAAGRPVRAVSVGPEVPLAVAWARDGKALAVGDGSGAVRLLDPDGGDEQVLQPGRGMVSFNPVAVSADGRKLAHVHQSGQRVRVWDLPAARDHQDLPALNNEVIQHWDLALFPDGKTLVAGGRQFLPNHRTVAVVRVWDLAARKPLATIPGDEEAGVQDVAASPTGQTVAWVQRKERPRPPGPNPEPRVRTADNTVVVWDVATRKERTRWTLQSEFVLAAFAPDGQALALGLGDGSVTVKSIPGPPKAGPPKK